MSTNPDPWNQLGANAAEYGREMSLAEEEDQFEWAAAKSALIVRALQSLPHLGRVADIGCRTGREAAHYAAQARIEEMYGFDISDVPLARARERGLRTGVWVSGLSPFPADDDFFDAVIAGDLIEHLVDTDVFLDELRRVLVPGGFLLITTPNLAWWWSRLRFLCGRVPHGIGSVSFLHAESDSVDKKHLRVSVNSEWLHLFRRHDFECLSVSGYHYPTLLRRPFRRMDAFFTRRPSTARSNLFVLRKPHPSGAA